jgi:amino acid adenylation domain-containing protein
MMERSIDIIIGIFGVLKAGAAYLPVDPGYPPERIEYMLKDSGAKILLTNSSEGHRFNCQLSIVNCQLLMIGEAQPAARSPQLATSLAYIIYTSGSTGKPKGVLVEHRSLVNIITALQREYPLGKSDVYLFKTSFLFDVSAAEIFGWFLEGGRLAILGKGGEKDPQEIMDTIESAGVTHINFVPSMFNVFVDGLDPQNINKLSSLQYIFLAGEALLPEPVNKFRKLNRTIKLENIFGPTEGTVYSSKYSLAQWSGRGGIPIGKPMQNTGLYILDKNNHLQSPGAVGELCISGVGLARGYLNNPELTSEKFLSSLLLRFSASQLLSFSLYRTGDLARWLPDGNVEFLGRIDRQVKVRGFRIELGEIESRLLAYEGIKEAVVVGKEDRKGDKYLCAYIVSDVEPDMAELRDYLSKELPDYMLPSYFVRLERIPLTPNGKIDLKGLPEPESKAGENYAAPRDEIERKLVKLYSEVLGIGEASISINASFFELGGHSLKVTVLVSKIHKEFHVKLLQAEIFRAPRIRELGDYIKGMVKDEYESIGPAEAKEYYALSAGQKRLYILQQMMVEHAIYNMPYVIPLAKGIDKEKLEPVFKALIARHESLRTSFITFNQEPIQRIHRAESSYSRFNQGL